MFSLKTTTNPSATTKCRCPIHLNPYKLWVMDLELLQSISLAVSQVRAVETVLKMIVAGLVDTAGVALARIWLLGPGDLCSTCKMSSECSDRTSCLHLAARRWPFTGRLHRLVSTRRFFPAVSSGCSKDRLGRL